MQIKIDEQRDALHPSEVVIKVMTVQGFESLVVDRSSIDGDLLEIGQPIGKEQSRVLVELPRETYSGAWRVWVPQEKLIGLAA